MLHGQGNLDPLRETYNRLTDGLASVEFGFSKFRPNGTRLELRIRRPASNYSQTHKHLQSASSEFFI